MKTVPTVFISSVVYTLKGVREKILDLITKYGWDCDASGISDRRFWGSSLSACRGRVESADLYLGIFWHRSGSLVLSDNTFITELEFYRALNSRKPMQVYILEADSAFINTRLELFLKLQQNEPELGLYIRRCKDINELIRKVKEDLDHFSECWDNGTTNSLIPPLLLEEALDKSGVFEDEVISYDLSYGRLTRENFDKDSVVQRLNLMRNYYEHFEFPQAAEIGVDLVNSFLSIGLFYGDKELTHLWAEMLKMWAGSCIWLSYIKGQFGALRAALMRKEAYRILEDWNNYYESDGLIANCYYVLASKIQAGNSYATSAKEERERNKTRHNILKKTLDYDESCRINTDRPFPYLHRAYVFRELGKYNESISDFKRMVNYKGLVDERTYHDYLVNLGYSLVLRGLNQGLRSSVEEGLVLIKEAEPGLQKFFSSPFYISYMKKIARSYFEVGELERARSMLNQLFSIAIERKLTHQAETISALLEKSQHP